MKHCICTLYTSLVPGLLIPLTDCLQYANTKGESWEIWSHAVTSYRQSVDTWKYLTKTLKTLSSTISLRAGGQKASKAASISFVVHNARDGSA